MFRQRLANPEIWTWMSGKSGTPYFSDIDSLNTLTIGLVR